MSFTMRVVDGGAGASGELPRITSDQYVCVEQDLFAWPPPLPIFAELVLDGEVIATSVTATVGPARRPDYVCFVRFLFPPLTVVPQFYGVRYFAIDVTGRRLDIRMDVRVASAASEANQ